MDEHGTVEGTARLSMSGQEALYWRQLALEKDRNEFSKKFNDWIGPTLPEGVKAEFDHFEALDDYNANLIASAKVSGTLGSSTGKRLILPGLFFESRGKHPFVAQDTRSAPIDLHYALMEEDEVTYHLPAGFAVAGNPLTVNLGWGDHGTMTVRSAAKDGSVKVTRAFVRNSAVLDAGYYSMLHEFYMGVNTADQQQIVLTRTNAANGD